MCCLKIKKMTKSLSGDLNDDDDQVTPIQLTSTFDVFGDSISDSRSPGFQQTWARLLAIELGRTVQGTGISGALSWQVLATQIYNNSNGNRTFTSTNSAAILMGTNDIRALDGLYTANGDIITEQINAIATTALLYCSLPAGSKYNSRSSIETGTWGNTASYTTIGRGTAVLDSTMTQTVTGRYVSFTLTAVAATDSAYQGAAFNWAVTNSIINLDKTVGTISNTTDPVWPGVCKTAPKITNGFLARSYIIDTGVTGPHTITITNKDATETLYVDWFGGWDDNVIGNTTIILGVPQYNYARIFDLTGVVTRDNDIRREAYNTQLQKTCDMLRKNFKLPVYYIDTGATPCGHTSFDGLHPNFTGQKYLASVVYNALREGVN